MKQDFSNVKENDEILVEIRGAWSNNREYVKGLVVNVTKTRFTVEFGERKQVFTKDGKEYPRLSGYRGSDLHIEPMTKHGEDLIVKYRAIRIGKRLANGISEIFENANYREKIFSPESSLEEIAEITELLKTVYNKFKNLLPEEKRNEGK
jgi:hypothetical protein